VIVYFSTVVRTAPEDRAGELVKLDWTTKRVLGRVPIRAEHPAVSDPNPRGSTRGGRGILLDGDRVLVASYHSILAFDRNLRFLEQITHPLFANLHELAFDHGDIWATSTDIDAAIKIDLSGRTIESWWPREDPVTSTQFRLEPLSIEKSRDNRTAFVGTSDAAPSHVHLNAAAGGNGDCRPMMLLNRFGAVVRLNPTEVLVADPSLRGCHNLVSVPGAILVNNTRARSIHAYEPDGALAKRIPLLQFSAVRRILYRHAFAAAAGWLGRFGKPQRVFRRAFAKWSAARPLFVRGLHPLDKDRILVGLSPATILEIDWRAEKLLDSFTYSGDRQVCVHGLVSE
jgi:hypothetical protein